MRIAPLLPLVLAAACADRQIQGDRPDVHLKARPFSASLAFDPPSFQLHGACGRGLTGQVHRPRQVTMTVNSGYWIVSPFGSPAQFEKRNVLQAPFGPIGGGPRLPATYTWSPAVSGNYEIRAILPGADPPPQTTVGPEPYVVPLDVGLKIEPAVEPGFLRATATANTNSGAPTIFAYSFCVRSADGSANDQWSPALMGAPRWNFMPPQPGPWLVYVTVFATQQDYPVPPNDWAGIGEQIAHYP